MPIVRHHLVPAAAALLLAGPVLLAPSAAAAQGAAAEQTHDYAIPGGPLTDVLNRFALASGLSLSGDGALTAGKSSPGLQGRYTASAGLARLLAGTGLAYRMSADGAVIEPAAKAGAAASLSTLNIEAAGDRHAGAADRSHSTYVTREDIDRRNPQDMKDLFGGESSVSVGGAIPLSQKVYVNGVEETNLAVSIDGARQNNKVFHHSGTNIIDPALLKVARVDPTVAPADAGPSALGGSIVYETVDVDDLLAPGRAFGGFVTTSVTSNAHALGTGAAGYGRIGDGELLGFVNRSSGDNYEDGDGRELPGTAPDLTSGLVKTAYDLGGHRFELSAERVEDDANRPFRANIGQLPGRPDPVTRVYELERQNYAFNYSRPGATGLWDPRVVIGHGGTEIRVPEPFGSIGETESFSAVASNDFNFGSRHSLTFGFDYYDDEAIYRDPATPEIGEKAENLGAFAQARLQPVEPVKISLGVRSDHQTFEGVDGDEQDNDGISSNVFVTWDLFERLQLRGGYSDVWGGVFLAENYILNPNWVYTDIDPVESENMLFGLQLYLGGGVSLESSIFESDFENARDESFGGGPDLTTDFKTEGYDVALNWRWLSGFARLSYTDTEITIDGDPADTFTTQYFGTPLGQVFALEARQDIPSLGLAFGGTVDAALENKDTERAGSEPLDSYEVLNLYTEFAPPTNPHVTLRLEVNNLLDETYADRATYGQEFPSVIPLFEPGRTVLFQARLRY